jgi:hypothetical protein
MLHKRKPLLLLAILFALSACDSETPSNSTAAVANVATDPVQTQQSAPESIDEFFTRFTDRWMEGAPNAPVSTGYFSGEKQNEMETRFNPQTREYEISRITLARDGLAVDLRVRLPHFR